MRLDRPQVDCSKNSLLRKRQAQIAGWSVTSLRVGKGVRAAKKHTSACLFSVETWKQTVSERKNPREQEKNHEHVGLEPRQGQGG